MNSFFRTPVFYVILLGLLNSCGPKQASQSVQMSANRKMAIILKSIQPNTAEAKSYYENLIAESIRETYQSKTEIIHIEEGSLIESPENMFKVAKTGIDDLFVFDIKLPSDQWMPPTAPANEAQEDEMRSQLPSQAVEIMGKVVNGANLRTITLLKANLPWGFQSEFEQNLKEEIKKVAMNSYANPNIYPPSDPLHFANLLYVYSEGLEQQATEAMTCENAKSILSHYDQAYQLFEKAKNTRNEVAVGSQERIHELNLRLDQAKRKSDILKKCEEDKTKSFEFLIDYGSIDPSYQPYIRKAFETVKLEELLKKYTNKPVKLAFNLGEAGAMSLNIGLRYDSQQYIAWTKGRIPATTENYHLVSLDPYHPLMQTLVLLKYYIPAEAPQPLKSSFLKMEINLALETLLNGQMSFRVAGSYNSAEKRVQLAYPKSIFLVSPGFESKSIFTRSDEIFQEKGWLAFGSCKTIDGTLTEDGLVLRFLGLDCKI